MMSTPHREHAHFLSYELLILRGEDPIPKSPFGRVKNSAHGGPPMHSTRADTTVVVNDWAYMSVETRCWKRKPARMIRRPRPPTQRSLCQQVRSEFHFRWSVKLGWKPVECYVRRHFLYCQVGCWSRP